MRNRTFYGLASSAQSSKTAHRTNGTRRPVTQRGRAVLQASRRRTVTPR